MRRTFTKATDLDSPDDTRYLPRATAKQVTAYLKKMAPVLKGKIHHKSQKARQIARNARANFQVKPP